jgi:opacity protein-like surface antigen
MKIKQLIVTTAFLFSTQPAFAEITWYAGIDIGSIDHHFYPEYTEAGSGEVSSFRDDADGLEAGLLAGVSIPLARRFSMAVQARIARTNSEWTLYLPNEPADFSYKIPTTFALSIVPAFQLSERVSIFGELGYINGDVNERKTSPSADRSSYDFSDWVDGRQWGLGLAFSLNPDWSLQAVYRETDYSDFDYKSYLPNGMNLESIKDSPEAESFGVGLIYTY